MTTETHRVAVVVFVTAVGVDRVDAGRGATLAVHQALSGGSSRTALPIRLHATHTNPVVAARPFDVVDVVELGMACGNGYLWTEPAAKAWRQYGHPDPGSPQRQCENRAARALAVLSDRKVPDGLAREAAITALRVVYPGDTR